MGDRGFTFIETMVALTIFSFAVAIVLLIYTKGYLSYVTENNKIEVQENLRISLNKMSADLRRASGYIKIYESDGSVSTDGTGPKIEFKDPSGEIVQYSFDQADKEVEVKKGSSGSPQPLASHIENLEFHYDQSKKIVTIVIKGEKENTNPPVIVDLSTKVLVRSL